MTLLVLAWTRRLRILRTQSDRRRHGGTLFKNNNRLTRTTLNPAGNSPQQETYLFDAHGNKLRMPHPGSGCPERTFTGTTMINCARSTWAAAARPSMCTTLQVKRVRKVWEKSPGHTEERIYLGGFEIFRKHRGAIGANTATLERETLHVMDDKQRIALVETRTLDTAGNDQSPRQLIRYQFGNHLGSASLELDDEGQIISYEEYAPYGSSTYQAVRSQTETEKRYRYTGKERDEESGLYYHGARYYADWLGRWTAADPAGLVDGPNLYVYGRGNPLSFTDSSGTQCDPTNACCVDPTLATVDDESMTCRARDALSQSSTRSSLVAGSVSSSSVGTLFGIARTAAPVSRAIRTNWNIKVSDAVRGTSTDQRRSKSSIAVSLGRKRYVQANKRFNSR